MFEMDEYVLDLAGMPLASAEGTEMGEHLKKMVYCCLDYFILATYRDMPELSATVFNAFYLYGMAIGMSRLGMH